MTDTDKDTTKADKREPVKGADGEPVRDFASFDDATAQAQAIGKGAWVESIGTAHRVNDKSD